MQSASFDSAKISLHELLKEIGTGKISLPDFQRDWVWDDEHIKSLIESVAESFPIGAVMMLETGKTASFSARLVEGVDPSISGTADELILDGQQRLTFLYQALMTKQPVQTRDTKGKAYACHYYFDMKKAVDPSSVSDDDEIVFSISEDRIDRTFRGEVTCDLSDREREYETCLFPADQILDSSDWRTGFNDYWWERDKEISKLFNEFEKTVIKRFEQYYLPVITLGRDTSPEAICLVFRKVNTGGINLGVFELMTASFAAKGFNLRDDWKQREDRLKTSHSVLGKVGRDQFLQVVTMLATQKRYREAELRGQSNLPRVGCKGKDILNLTRDEYTEWAQRVEDGFGEVAQFLRRQKIFRADDVPYQAQLVPLAAILVELGPDAEPPVQQKRSLAGSGTALWVNSMEVRPRLKLHGMCLKWWTSFAARKERRKL